MKSKITEIYLHNEKTISIEYLSRLNERYEAWGNLARKLAHEIKNPLTPIQLTIDRMKTKYSNQVNEDDKKNFDENLKIINNQIKPLTYRFNQRFRFKTRRIFF